MGLTHSRHPKFNYYYYHHYYIMDYEYKTFLFLISSVRLFLYICKYAHNRDS
jgi:hypothetical protein